MSSRVYLAATLDDLAAWHAAAKLPATSADGWFLAASDDEEDEYAALLEAAAASAAQQPAGARRVVVVAEVGEGALADDAGPIPWRRVVAVHADAAPGAAPDDDLGWWATQEVPALLER